MAALAFVFTENAGSFHPGKPYESRWKDDNLNIMTRLIHRPQMISEYFEHSNIIDTHNHCRQGILKLEECWVTQSIRFRVPTTFIGITIIDAMKGYQHHLGLRQRHKYNCRKLHGYLMQANA